GFAFLDERSDGRAILRFAIVFFLQNRLLLALRHPFAAVLHVAALLVAFLFRDPSALIKDQAEGASRFGIVGIGGLHFRVSLVRLLREAMLGCPTRELSPAVDVVRCDGRRALAILLQRRRG